MVLRRASALLLSTALCALALAFGVPLPGTTTLTAPAPQAAGVYASIDEGLNSDAKMLALHRQASAAMASLQAATPDR